MNAFNASDDDSFSLPRCRKTMDSDCGLYECDAPDGLDGGGSWFAIDNVTCLQQDLVTQYLARIETETARVGVACTPEPTKPSPWQETAEPACSWPASDAFGLVAIISICVGLLLGVVLAAFIHRRLHPHRYRKKDAIDRRRPGGGAGHDGDAQRHPG